MSFSSSISRNSSSEGISKLYAFLKKKILGFRRYNMGYIGLI